MTFPALTTGSPWTASYHNTYVKAFFEKNPPHTVTAKGDLPVATAAGVVGMLALGTNGYMLESRASEATGRKWVVSGLVPLGGILMWSGSVATIPTGWALCDGTGGTPDLRGRFIIGSGTTYAIGDSGGSATANLAHTHTTANANTDTSGAHTHTTTTPAAGGTHAHQVATPTDGFTANGAGAGSDLVTNIAASLHTHSFTTFNTSTDGSHTHTIPTSGSDGGHTHTIPTATTGSALSATQSLLPPYYAVCFVQRIS